MDKLELKAEPRETIGRKVKNLRKQGLLPANIFGKKVKSQSVAVKLDDFLAVYKKAGETSLVNLILASSKGENGQRAVLISNIQFDPVSDAPLHVDFHQVDLKEKVAAKVPVELSGESPAEKQSLGTVVTYINEIEVEALPADLPEKFVIDISKLDAVDQVVAVHDLDYDQKKVTVKIDLGAIVVKVEPPQKEEVVPTPAPTEAVGPEGAVPAESKTPAESAAEPAEKPEVPEEKK